MLEIRMSYESIIKHVDNFLEKTVANNANLEFIRKADVWYICEKYETTHKVYRGLFRRKAVVEPCTMLRQLLRVRRGGYQSFYISSLTAEWDIIAKQLAVQISSYGSDVDLTMWGKNE